MCNFFFALKCEQKTCNYLCHTHAIVYLGCPQEAGNSRSKMATSPNTSTLSPSKKKDESFLDKIGTMGRKKKAKEGTRYGYYFQGFTSNLGL